MSVLADLEIALRRDRAFGRLVDTHLHRATREATLGITKGRDAIIAAWVASLPGDVVIDADLGDMIAYTVDGRWPGHRWVWRERDWIGREVVIDDDGAVRVATLLHAPLGELRAGMGQSGAGQYAVLPPGWPDSARELANRLHRSWNGRAFDGYRADWLDRLLVAAPDATFYFERAVVTGPSTALLWRMHGHAQGRRLRLIGSSIFGPDADTTVIDQAALVALQLQAGTIDYA